MKPKENRKVPSVRYSLVTVLAVIAIIALGMTVFDASLQVMMLLAILILLPVVMYLGYSYQETEKFALEMMAKALVPSLIVMVIGTLVATWIASGTVPMIIYIGLKFLSPAFFLVVTFLLCSALSMLTGTSWGTLATSGVAMMGAGSTMGIPMGLIAGAIVGGSFFGDKYSPLSSSSIISTSVTGTPIGDHFKHNTVTTIPAFLLTTVLYLIIGFRYRSGAMDTEYIGMIMTNLESLFRMGFFPLLPVLIVSILLIRKKPVIPSLLIGAIAAGFVAIFYQGMEVSEVFRIMYQGNVMESGVPLLDEMLTRGGILSMMDIVLLMIFGFGIGGLLNGSGILSSLLKPVSKLATTPQKLLTLTGFVNLVGNMLGGIHEFFSSADGNAHASAL